MGTRFRPPRDVPDIGATPPLQARFKAWLRTAFVEIAEDLASIDRDATDTLIAQETIDVDVPSLRRVTPPVGGMGVRLPPPSAENAGKSVRLMIESPVGALTVVSRPGIGDDGKVSQPTVNGEPRATFSVSGLVVLTSNGVNDWKTDAEFPAESPAVAEAQEDQAGIDATYHLAVAHPDLPNARVATGSTEIAVDNTSPGLVSWFLNTASIAFSKLNNLAGLSVLGRSASSSGVMAAITASGGDMHLVTNAAGTAVQWVTNRSQQFDDTVSGTLDPYLLDASFNSGDSLVWVITGDTTLNRIRMSDGSVPPDGTWLFLSLRDQSGGSAPGHSLTLPDTGATTTNGSIRPPGQVQGTSPGPSYVMRSEEEGCIMVCRAGNWRLVAGTAQQLFTGAIENTAGNGGTNNLTFSAAAAGAGLTRSVSNTALDVVGSTSIVVTSDEVRRAALTGAIAAPANSNATLFSGIRVDGSDTTDRQRLNLIAGTGMTITPADNAGSDSIDVTFESSGGGGSAGMARLIASYRA